FRCLAEGQRLGLRKHVRHEYVVMPAQQIQRLVEGQKVAGDQARSLVNKLVERVLPVRARLAPKNWARGIVDVLTVERDGLAVALHRELLQVCREALEVLLVRQHGLSLRAKKIRVP